MGVARLWNKQRHAIVNSRYITLFSAGLRLNSLSLAYSAPSRSPRPITSRPAIQRADENEIGMAVSGGVVVVVVVVTGIIVPGWVAGSAMTYWGEANQDQKQRQREGGRILTNCSGHAFIRL